MPLPFLNSWLELAALAAAAILVVVLVLLRRMLAMAQRPIRILESTLDTLRQKTSDLSARLAHLERSSPAGSPLVGSISRRLGTIEAIAESIARDVELALGQAEPAVIRAVLERSRHRARRIGYLAAGGRAREHQTSLPAIWPRVPALLGDRLANQTVRTAFADDCPPVVGAGEVWVQILAALVENAAEAAPAGGLITVGAEPDDSRRGFVRVWVEDRGRGIAPEVLPHVLEPFYTSRAAAGAEGLGLSMVAALVEGLGGSVALSSRVGDGTRVSMTVPEARAPSPHSTLPRLAGTILVADDDAAVREHIARFARTLGLQVVEADSGSAARAALSDPARYRAAVLDVVMPGTPVDEVVSRVREVRADFPVLLVSGYDTIHMVDAVLALGGVRFLKKPFEIEEFAASLEDLFTVGE